MNSSYTIMGSAASVLRISCDQVMNKEAVLINTLPSTSTHFIRSAGTVVFAAQEVEFMQDLVDKEQFSRPIIIYGRHCLDTTPFVQANRLTALGFTRVSVYVGGLFEWALLNDLYGSELFPMLGPQVDPWQFKP